MSSKNNDILNIIKVNFPGADIKMIGGGCNCSLEVVSSKFNGMTKFKRQQKVLACIKSFITSGRIHSVTIIPYTPEEYKNNG